MSTVNDLLNFAAGEVGYSRWDDPLPGTKYGRWFADITGSPYFGESGVPYCAMYVSYCLAMTNTSCEGFPRAVAIDRRDGFSRMVEPCDLRPGDVVGFDWDYDWTGDHVGIVKERCGDIVWIETYEGNTNGGQVCECVRHIDNVTIGVRPYFDGVESPAAQKGILVVDGIIGYNSVKGLQQYFGTRDDGVISGQDPRDDVYRRNVWSYDYCGDGSDVVKALQKHIGADPDRYWGYETTDKLQRHLARLDLYNGEFDHDFGHHSAESLQIAINEGVL